MNLEYEFSFRASLKPGLPVGSGPFGNRLVVEVSGGDFEGKRLSGKVLSGGGDWLIVGADGLGRVDVRLQFVTADGAAIYVQYFGLVEMNAKVQAALSDPKAGTEFADQYFRTCPRLETGDPRYAWVNQTVFLAEGRLRPGTVVEYKVYRVT
jgi:hypothetical protein